jgi:hypothetical protein
MTLRYAALVGVLLASPAWSQPGPFVEDSASIFGELEGYWLGSFWADADGDSDPDVLITDAFQNDRLYWNQGDGEFTMLPLEVNPHRETNGGGWADFDQDGRLDFVSASIGGAALLVNTGDPNDPFVHVPLAFDGDDTRDIVPADYDLDGDPDLAAVAWGGGLNLLYRNAGFGFALGQSLSEDVDGTTACWGDYDDDGWSDVVLVAGTDHHNQLYRSVEGVFEAVAESAVSAEPGNAQTCSWGDYDGDGDLDLFIGRAGPPGQPDQSDRLFRNDDGVFAAIEDALPFDTTRSFGSAWGDIDHDGDLDLVVVARDEPDVLYLNDGEGGFVGERMGGLDDGWSISASLIDHDSDGDLDLLTTHGCYAAPGRNRFYVNETAPERRWMEVELRGVDSDRWGLGARLWAHATIDGTARVLRRDMLVRSGRMAQSAYRVHFGLGDAERVDSLVIAWPSGTRQVVLDLSANGIYSVTEDFGVASDDDPAALPPSIAVAPNPTSGSFRIVVAGLPDGPIDIEIVDVLGRRVATFGGTVVRGAATVDARAGDALAAGRYQLRVVGIPGLTAPIVRL